MDLDVYASRGLLKSSCGGGCGRDGCGRGEGKCVRDAWCGGNGNTRTLVLGGDRGECDVEEIHRGAEDDNVNNGDWRAIALLAAGKYSVAPSNRCKVMDRWRIVGRKRERVVVVVVITKSCASVGKCGSSVEMCRVVGTLSTNKYQQNFEICLSIATIANLFCSPGFSPSPQCFF